MVDGLDRQRSTSRLLAVADAVDLVWIDPIAGASLDRACGTDAMTMACATSTDPAPGDVVDPNDVLATAHENIGHTQQAQRIGGMSRSYCQSRCTANASECVNGCIFSTCTNDCLAADRACQEVCQNLAP